MGVKKPVMTIHPPTCQSVELNQFPTFKTRSKRGDSYLRTLLIHGARAVIRASEHKPDADPWIRNLLARRNKNVAAVALANKNARTIWALLAHGREYQANYARTAA
jgi:transposase